MYEITIPKTNEDFAEFMGICFGDGCLSINRNKHNYGLYIAANSIDEYEYLNSHVSNLLTKLFGIKASITKQESNTLVLTKYSRQLLYFLNKRGMPIGKKNNLSVPIYIKKSKRFMRAFIRGVFDTDGFLSFKRRYKDTYYYPHIGISSKCFNFIVELREFLLKEGFILGRIVKEIRAFGNENKGKKTAIYKISLYGVDNLERWLRLIGTNNSKNQRKYSIWKKYGYYDKKLVPAM